MLKKYIGIAESDNDSSDSDSLFDIDLEDPLIDVERSNADKAWPTSFRQLPPRIKWLVSVWAVVSAVQTDLNGFSISHNLFFSEDANCAVGDFNCYAPSAWEDKRSAAILYFIVATLALNILIFLYYSPKAFVRMLTWDTWKTPKGYLAALLAAAASVVSYKQGMDALTLFSNLLVGTKASRLGKPIDMIMLTASVSSTFCTREEGAFNVMELYQLRYYGLHLDKIPYLLSDERKADYKNHSVALSIKDILYANEYDWTPDQRERVFADIIDLCEGECEEISSESLQLIMAQSKRNCEPLYQVVYWLAKAAFLFLALISYNIIFNIVKSTFPGKIWAVYFAPIVALSSPIFYLSTLGRMPDAECRVFKKMMFYDAKTTQEQIRNFSIYLAIRLFVLGSCGNFLYNAWQQVQSGQFDYLQMSLLMTTILWSMDGAAVSLFVNWFAADNIYIEETDDPVLYKASQKAQGYIKKAILEGGEFLQRLASVKSTLYSPPQSDNKYTRNILPSRPSI